MKDDGKTPGSYQDLNNLTGWEELGTFKQEKQLHPFERWCYYSWNTMNYPPLSEEELAEAEAEFMEISVPLHIQGGNGFRYLKIVINDVFAIPFPAPAWSNADNYVQFHELEVYTDKTN